MLTESRLQPAHSSPHRQIRASMLGAIIFVALTAIIGMALQARSLRKSESEMETMNLTGRQRMLCQRIGRIVGLCFIAEDSQREVLKQRFRLDLVEINKNADRIYFLMDQQIQSRANLQEVRDVFSAARDQRNALVQAAWDFDESSSNTDPNLHALAMEVQHASDEFLQKIERAVMSLQSYGENRVNSDIRQVYMLAGLLLVVIVFVVLFIVEPAVQVLRKQNAIAFQLRLEMERLASVAQLTTNAVVVTDATRKITWVNDGFTRITGYAFEDAIGKNPGQLLQSENTDKATIDAVRNALNTEQSFQGTILNRSKCGRDYWIELDIQPQRDVYGKLKGFIAIETDVTTKKNEQDRLKSTFSAVAAGIIELNASGEIVDGNPAAEQILGLTLEHMRGRKPSDLRWCAIRVDGSIFPADDHPSSVTLRTGIPIADFVHGIQTPDGVSRWISVSTSPIVDCHGKVLSVITSFGDVTALIASERALSQAKADAEAALRETKATRMALDEHSLLSVTNRSGCIVEANQGFCRVSGYLEAELIGQDHRILNSGVHPKSFWIKVWRTISSGQAWRGEVCNRRKDGALYWVDSTIVPYFGSDGKIEKYVSIRFDITAQKAAESGLVAAQLQADAANIAKSEFLANMSHEIRTPMTAILGFTDLLEVELRNSNCSAECVEYIDIIDRNGEHLLQIINDILDLSKIEAGKMTVEHVDVNICQLIQDVLSLMDVRAKSKGLTLEAVIDTNIPLVVESDPVRLRQILVNLVGNAIKFTELGGVTVRAAYDASKGMMRFDVIDTGIGMTPDQASKMFQAFVQADASTTRQFGGTGLGLQISKRLAEMLGGNILLESQFAKGSKFSVTIAVTVRNDVLMIEHNTDISTNAKLLRSPSLDHIAQPKPAVLKLDGMRIILAEDGPDNQRLLGHILRKAGAVVTIVENGKLAVECLTVDGTLDGQLQNPPICDLLLTDMQMPIMDGYEATAYLRKKGSTLPIVALTANVMSSDVSKCLRAGCDDYASKPIDKHVLIETCEKWWQASRESEESISKLRKSVDELVDIWNETNHAPPASSLVSIQI